MSVREDIVRTRIEIEGNQAINQIGKYEMEIKNSTIALKNLKKGTEEWNAENKKLSEAKAAVSRLREEMGLTGMTLKQLKSYQRELNLEISNMTKGTAAYEATRAKLLQVNEAVRANQLHLQGSSKAWEFLKSQVAQFGALALGFIGFQVLFGQIQNLITGAAKLSDQLADIRKTTGMTAEETDRFNRSLKDIDTRTASEELRNIAIVAGQIGIAKQDILAFTDATDKLVVALGDEFKGGAEEITKVLGGLKTIFNETREAEPSKAMLNIGNALNELGAAGSATSPVMADFANRIGGVGASLGLTAPQILGLSATLQELNVTAERGGTAVTKILQKMTTNTAEFAQIAGMSLEDFANLLNNDIYGAFVKVAEGSQKGGKSTMAFGQMMKDAELSSAGAAEVFTKVGMNTELLADKLAIATEAFGETNSIMDEFTIKNTNLAADLSKIQKFFASAFASIGKGIEPLIHKTAQLVENLKQAAKTKEELEKDRLNANVKTEGENVPVRIRNEAFIKGLKEEEVALQMLNLEMAKNEDLKTKIQAIEVENKISHDRAKQRNAETLKQLKEELLYNQERLRVLQGIDLVTISTSKPKKSFVAEVDPAEQKRLIKEAGDYAKMMEEARIAMIQDARVKEFAQAEQAYQAKKAKFKLNAEDEKLLLQEHEQNLAAIKKKYDDMDVQQFEAWYARDKEAAQKALHQKLEGNALAHELTVSHLEAQHNAVGGLNDQQFANAKLAADRAFYQEKLNILKAANQQESAEYKRTYQNLVNLNYQKNTRVLAAEKNHAQAISTVASSVGNFMTTMLQIGSQNASEMTQKQKDMAVAQIAINTGVSVAGIIASASQMQPYPVAIASIIGGVATVIANIANASAILSSSTAPEPANVKPNPSAPNFYTGTEFLNGPSGIDQVNINASRGERIVPVNVNEKLVIKNSELPAAQEAYMREKAGKNTQAPVVVNTPSHVRLHPEDIAAIAERIAQKVNNKKVELNYTYLQEEEAKLKLIKEKA